MKKTMILLGGALVLALLALAGVAPGSEQKPAEGFSHLQELTAMNARYQGHVKLLAASRRSFVSHLADLNELKDQSLPLARLAVAPGHRRDSPSAGFAWDDAAIGAATAAMLITLIGASTLLFLRIQRRHRPRTT